MDVVFHALWSGVSMLMNVLWTWRLVVRCQNALVAAPDVGAATRCVGVG